MHQPRPAGGRLAAAANGLNTLMRSIGTSISSAVIGVVPAHMTQPLGGAAMPSLNGFRAAFAIACGAGVIALTIGVFIPGRAKGRTAFTVRPSAEAEPQILTPKS